MAFIVLIECFRLIGVRPFWYLLIIEAYLLFSKKAKKENYYHYVLWIISFSILFASKYLIYAP